MRQKQRFGPVEQFRVYEFIFITILSRKSFRLIKQAKMVFLRQSFFCEGVECRKLHQHSIIRKIFTSSIEYCGGNYTSEVSFHKLFEITYIAFLALNKMTFLRTA